MASIAFATTASSPTAEAPSLPHCRRLLAVPEPATPAPAADYRERYQQLTGRSLNLSVLRRSHDRDRYHLPRDRYLCRHGSLEHLMIPSRDPITAFVSGSGLSMTLPCSRTVSRWRQVPSRQSSLRARGDLYSSIHQPPCRDHRYHRPRRASPARHREPAASHRLDHRQRSISIGRKPRSAASFNQASVQSRDPTALDGPCHRRGIAQNPHSFRGKSPGIPG